MYPLYEVYPQIREVPRLELGKYPTPLKKIKMWDKEFYVKDDSKTSTIYGGNKVRKLEYSLAKAVNARANSVLTYGGTASNHIVATALLASKLGLATGAVMFNQPLDENTGKKYRYIQQICPVRVVVPYAPLIFVYKRNVLKRLEAPTFVIPPGASTPDAILGYVNAAMEFVQQANDMGLRKPRIYVAAGTCGTAAGLYLGLALAGMESTVVPVVVSSRLIANTMIVKRKARAASVNMRVAGVQIIIPTTFADYGQLFN